MVPRRHDREPRRWRSRWWTVGLIFLCLAGCGYHTLGGEGQPSAVRGKRVAVPMFGNRTYRPNLETLLTGSLRDEVAWRSGGRVVEVETADVVITGTVVSFAAIPVSYDQNDRVREYRATMTIEASMRRRETGEVVWKGLRSLSQEYPVIESSLQNRAVSERVVSSTKVALQQNSEEAAVRELCRRLAQDLYEIMSEGF